MYAPIPMVPGPVTLPKCVLDALSCDYPSGQIDPDFLALYASCERALQKLMGTKNRVLIMTGEGMLVLWGALKSVVNAKDRVFVVANGVFSQGMYEMAKTIGCQTELFQLDFDSVVDEASLSQIAGKVASFRPTVLCACHCETPSGTLNPLEGLAKIKRDLGIPLFYVDMVSSLGGTPIDVDALGIDLALGGSQKCLSLPPSLSFSSVSPSAFARMEEVNYQGYDAFLPFKTIYQDGRCPYTPDWHGFAALYASLNALFHEGLTTVYARHNACQRFVLSALAELHIRLWPKKSTDASPTVTAALIPEGFSWPSWQEALRKRGLIVAGSFGPMAGKVFRLGHMGEQARMHLVQAALDVIEIVLHKRQSFCV
ncbi:MAG: alanine--glyoxylate aminotransferase family protein [Desulfovibrio sp.]|nr:alanine--glyoxylate aminotransferase family protein [Desulfovibrio sp.]